MSSPKIMYLQCLTIMQLNILCPVILVGNKIDLRSDRDRVKVLAAKGQRHVTYKEGVAWAKKIGAVAYVECSAKEGQGLVNVFEQALKEHFKEKGETKTRARPNICCWKGGVPDHSGNSTE